MRHSTVQVNGIDLGVRAMGDPDAPLMLFLHGFPEYSGAWDEVLPAFAGSYHAVAPDQRGYAALLQARGTGGLPRQGARARRPGARRALLPRPALRAGGARLGRLGRLRHGHGGAGAHRQAGHHQRRAPRPLPARAAGGRCPAPGQQLHALPARSPSRGAPLRQQLREADGHAGPLRPAALADAGEACRLPRGLVAEGRADRHAQLVSRLAAAGAEAGRGNRPCVPTSQARPREVPRAHAASRDLGHGRPRPAAGDARDAPRLLRRSHRARDRGRRPLGGAPEDG